MSVEHPLEPERATARAEQVSQMLQARGATSGLGVGGMLALLALTLCLVLLQRYSVSIPLWLHADARSLAHGQLPTLSLAQLAWLAPRVGGACLGALLLALIAVALRQILRRRRPPLYDQRLVREKTSAIAYHARLRVYIMSEALTEPTTTMPHLPALVCVSRLVEQIRQMRRARWTRWTSAPQVWQGRLAHGARSSVPALAATFRRRLAAGALRARMRRWQRAERRAALQGFIAAYRQFHLANGGYFHPRQFARRSATWLLTRDPSLLSRIYHFWRTPGWRWGVRRSGHLLTIAEIAALWRLPQGEDLPYLPFVSQTRARTVLASAELARLPAAVPTEERTRSPAPSLPPFHARMGVSQHAGHTVPVYLPPDATRRNMLAVAKTGKGKSTLLLALARAALADKCGLVMIDPHGDLAEATLMEAARAGRDDALLVDLGDRDYPIGLNPLDVTLFPDRDKATSNVIAVLAQIWKEYWGPRMESALEAALKSLTEANAALVARDPVNGPDAQYTLLDVTPLLTFIAFRRHVLADVQDPALLSYWLRFEALQQRLQQDIITPVTTKLEKFANAAVARRIVGQGEIDAQHGGSGAAWPGGARQDGARRRRARYRRAHWRHDLGPAAGHGR